MTLSFIEACDQLDIKIREMIRRSKAATVGSNADSEMISMIDKMISQHNKSLAKLMSSHEEQLKSLSAKVTSSPDSQSDVNLPHLDLKSFSGEYSDWPGFYQFFRTTIHENKKLKAIQKFQYLIKSLNGEAYSVIQNLTVTDKGRRFDKPKSIIEEYFNSFFSQSELKTADVAKLRKIHSVYEGAIQGAENMGATTKDAWLVHFASLTLDPDTRELWSREPTEGILPTWKEFSDFLSRRCDSLEAYSKKNDQSSTSQPAQKKPVGSKVSSNKPQKQSTFINTATETCGICSEGSHPAWKCDRFLAQSPAQKLDTLRRLRMCINCLSSNHTNCARGSCKVCRQQHNSLVHDAFKQKVSSATKPTSVDKPATSAASGNSASLDTVDTYIPGSSSSGIQRTFLTRVAKSTLLPTVQVLAKGANGKLYKGRALLDACSQVNFASARFVDQLKLPKTSERNHTVSSINGVSTCIKSTTDINISSTDQQFQMAANFMVINKIVDEMPVDFVELDWQIPEHITLADPEFMYPGRIDLLLGADFDARARRSGHLQDNSPALLETAFGWVVQGAWNQTEGSQVSTFLNISSVTLDKSLTRFWEIEENCQQESTSMSSEELECEKYFSDTTKRDSEGRYIVRLPTRSNVSELGDSKFVAQQRFKQLERKLQANSELRTHYISFMNQYQELGHMRVLPDDYTSSRSEYYLPHHAVVRMSSSSTPVRVVFDASSKTSSSLSLNSVLKVGPRIQEDLFNILIRYRQYNHVLKADIQKMFRQVKMHEDDQNLQRILWRDSPEKPLQTFLLTTVTYGTASAPYLSTRCMQQLVMDDGDKFPQAKEIALKDFYVDDLLTGTQTIEEAINLQEQLTALFKGGGFPLKKWTSNRQEVLEHIPLEDRETQSVMDFNSEGGIKTLGLQWHPSTDIFTFSTAFKDGAITKRAVLSNMSRIFDPLGLISPVTITAKILMQKLWKENLDWDTELPDDLRAQWIAYEKDVQHLSLISIPRKFTEFEDVKHLQLYAFSDASQRAYSACIYARTINHQGDISCYLIAAKTRVSPLTTVTIPRLELCGAVLLVRLLKKVQSSLTMEVDDIRAFTDSTIVLHWIYGDLNRWKTFVRNRVAEIQGILPASAWSHVRSEDNPADLASRGVKTEELLTNNFWWNGPQWICDDINPQFNQQINPEDIPEDDTEQVKVCALMNIANPFWNIIPRYSSLTRLMRAVAILTRFTQFILNKCKRPCKINRGPLTSEELATAQESITKAVQIQSFSEDIHHLTRHKEVSKSSKIRNLHPFLDDRGLLRVGGRIERASTTYDHKHPLLLPSTHHFTDLVAREFHQKTLHGGPHLLLSTMRMQFWPIHGMTVAKRIVRECVKCFRVNPRGVEQLMSNCPENRVCQFRVFTHTGIDFCGPFYLKPLTRKGASPKVYVCVYICLTTRAVHLEMVESLTTDAFIGSLKRFTARRGMPQHIYCDNATNFVGASRELEDLKKLFFSEQHQNSVINAASDQGIRFHFIPPASPSFGGSWESCVKLFKTHFRRVAGDTKLTQEQMVTVIAQIEAIINSRPLTALSDDPKDFSVLTPGHFLIGAPLTAIPEPSVNDIPADRLGKWQHCQQIVEHFWKRWHKEYLHTLQTRNKWKNITPPVKINDLVLIRNDQLPPLKWTMGRVTNIHPGEDGLIRVVSLQTPHGITQRALPKICPLPKTSSENSMKLPAISPGQDVKAPMSIDAITSECAAKSSLSVIERK
ncbi:uncharacterized protein LOC129800919 [Phlebotomus papatasi]|uniref:uncharacterized protein LOC129800919 n=1 Tax=Phlebotomus papatasi TaxID=29031 RepID=UPI0024840A52|nr:uncharacterized protein LOC129800919 [Phlebotomus papatasi]